MKMQITKQEVEVMKFIGECGFCMMRQVAFQFDIKKSRAYKILRRLRGDGYIKYKRVMYDSPGVYFASSKGAHFSDLSVIDKVSAGKFHHQILVNDVFIRLSKIYSDSEWISERRLNQDKFQEGFGKRGHLSDGLLVFEDKQIAIEVELNPKAKVRLEAIIKNYITQFKFQEIWYFCSSNVLSLMNKIAGRFPFIKIFDLKEFLND